MYFDQSCRAFCAGCGQYAIFVLFYLIAAMDIQELSVRGICEALRGSDLWLVCLRTRRLLSPIQSSQSPRKMPAGVLDFSGQLSGISRAFHFLQPASQRATVERGQTRRNKVPTPRASHLAPPLIAPTTLHFAQYNHSDWLSRTVHVIRPIPPTR